MATSRSVYHNFWTDPDVEKLEPDAKLVFLQLMTNYRTSTSGIYQITFKAVSDETGIDRERVKSILTGGKADREIETGEIKNVYYDTKNSMIFVARFRVYNKGGAAEFIRKGLVREREVFNTRLWDMFDELYDEYGKPIQNGFETVCERFGNGSISNRNRDINKSKIVLSESLDKAFKAWLRVPGFDKAKPENIAAKLIELSEDPKFKRVDFYQLAITCRDCYIDDKKVAKRPSMVIRNWAKNAIKFETDLLPDRPANEPAKDKELPWPKEPPGLGYEEQDTWRNALDILSGHISAKEFDTWFQPTRCEGVLNGEIWIKVPNAFYGDNLETYLEDIKRALVEVGMPESVKVYIGTGG